MRDIRADLRERLASLDARLSDLVRDYNREKAELDKKFAEQERGVEEERKAASALLAIEDRRYGEASAPQVAIPTESLTDFLIRHVTAEGPILKEDLRNAAGFRGYFPDGEGGRTIHTTLLNLVRAGRLTETPDGRYINPTRLGSDSGAEEALSS